MASVAEGEYGKISYMNANGDYAGKTILEAVLDFAPGRNIFSFFRAFAASDAPGNEAWDYGYIVIPLVEDGWAVMAFRLFSASAFFVRHIRGREWTTPWYKFEGGIFPQA